MKLYMPWKVKKALEKLIGEDYIHNRASYKPDFRFSAIAYRLQETKGVIVKTPAELVYHFLGAEISHYFIPIKNVQSYADELEREYPQKKQDIIAAAQEMYANKYHIYHMATSPLNESFNWHWLKKGPRKDQLFMSRPQRFGFAAVFAQAALFEKKYVGYLDVLLTKWQRYAEKCRFRWPYNSSHALMYRLVSLNWVWLFIGALHLKSPSKATESVLVKVLSIIFNDINFLAPRLGDAHPNNHMLADYFSGWFINHQFAPLIPANRDFSHYEVQFHKELLKQFYPDGGNFEHAMHYHEHGTEMVTIYCLLKPKEQIPTEVSERIERMMNFQVSLMDQQGRAWELGDTTEDTLLPLDSTTGWSLLTIQQVHQQYFGLKQKDKRIEPITHKAFWLLDRDKYSSNELVKNSAKQDSHFFKDSGICQWKTSKHQLLYRTGVPKHVQFMPGHMHADILSLYWQKEGQDILPASGTFTYKFASNSEFNDRNYFCGPWSHSTVILNDEDPLGQLKGDFRGQDNKLRVKAHQYGDSSSQQAVVTEIVSDNIYNGLSRAVLNITDEIMLVVDVLTENQKGFKAGSNWLFSEQVEAVHAESSQIELRLRGEKFAKLCFNHNGEPSAKQQVTNSKGWLSRSYGIKKEVQQLFIEFPHGANCCAYLLISNPETNAAIKSIETSDKQSCVRFTIGDSEHIVQLSHDGSVKQSEIESLNFNAKAFIHYQHKGEEKLLLLSAEHIQIDNTVIESELDGTTYLAKQDDNWELSH